MILHLGSNCEHDVTKTALNIASFTGHSLLGILTQDDMVNRFEIELSFRSFSEDGLIFYAQGSTDSDYLSIALLNGYVEFRYDLGVGPAVLRSSIPIKLGHWHRLVAKRYHQDGFMSLDGVDRITGQTVGSIKTLNVKSLAFMGGVPEGTYKVFEIKFKLGFKKGNYYSVYLISASKSKVASNTEVTSGFIGCIKDVQLGRKLISIQSELEPRIKQRQKIVECSENPCSRMPCANGGSCEAHEQGYKCNCKPTFTGKDQNDFETFSDKVNQ